MDNEPDDIPTKKLRLDLEGTNDLFPSINGATVNGDHKDDVEKTESQKTVDYSMGSDLDSQGQGDVHNEVRGQAMDKKVTAQHENGQETGEDLKTEDMEMPPMTKIASVLRDAKMISSIISDTDIEKIYEKLKNKRKNPNRVDIIMNDVLENSGIYQITEKSELEDTSALLLGDFISVIDKAMANMESLPLSAEEIQRMLQNEGHRPDRVDRVFAQILKQLYPTRKVPEVTKVLLRVPDASPDEVEKLLSEGQGQGHTDVVEHVVSILQNRTVTNLRKDDSIPDDPTVRDDPLFKDMRIVKKIVPHRDPNEIYAYLEAHYDRRNRIKLVIEELLNEETDTEGRDGGRTAGITGLHMPSEGGLGAEVQELQEIFPDCDPNYLYNALEDMKDDKDRVKHLAVQMIEKKDYPKLKEMLENEEKLKKKQKIMKQSFNIKDFLAKFSDPEEFFTDKNRVFSNNYKKHVSVQLHNDFPNLSADYLQQILEAHNSSLTLCERAVMTSLSDLGEFAAELYITTPRAALVLPNEPDELFFNEMLYLNRQTQIQDYLREEEKLNELRKTEARANGELLTCDCCFDDECLFEEMASCVDGHLFCKDCIKRSSEVVIGDGKCDFPCLTENCDYKFPLSVLQTVMSPNMFSILLRKMQEEEIKQAAIPDLVSCPFCSFATIISNPHDKVFKCLNPECLKDSCRLCGELSHIPLKCDEVEREGETHMRTYIESRVSEAMLRTCHACRKRFIKEVGCNKMTCTCGATQCYVCRAEDIDYDHFETEGPCGMDIESSELHIREMEAAAQEARRQYIADHPLASDMVLKYDPTTHIEDVKRNVRSGIYDEDDDDDYDD